MTAWPNPLDLFGYLIALATAVVNYYVFAGDWAAVDAQSANIANWFQALFDHVATTAIELSGDFGEWLTNIWQDFKATWDNFLIIFTELYDWYQGVFPQVNTIVQDFYFSLVDFFQEYYPQVVSLLGNIQAYLIQALGAAWEFVQAFYADPLSYLASWLGAGWDFVASIASDPLAWITGLLGEAWEFLVSLAADPLTALTAILGDIWTQMVTFLAAPLEFITGLLGTAWEFLVNLSADPVGFFLSLLPFNLGDIIAFWGEFGTGLVDFFADPVTWILTYIREAFLAWLEQLIADNW